MGEHQQVDLFAVAVRFACGAVFGIVLGVWMVMTTERVAVLVEGALIGGAVGGSLSARYGSRFWEKVRHLLWFVP